MKIVEGFNFDKLVEYGFKKDEKDNKWYYETDYPDDERINIHEKTLVVELLSYTGHHDGNLNNLFSLVYRMIKNGIIDENSI